MGSQHCLTQRWPLICFIDPKKVETVLTSLHTILEKTGSNKFDPSAVKLHEHIDMIHATKKFHKDMILNDAKAGSQSLCLLQRERSKHTAVWQQILV
jgi:hypothetical protein